MGRFPPVTWGAVPSAGAPSRLLHPESGGMSNILYQFRIASCGSTLLLERRLIPLIFKKVVKEWSVGITTLLFLNGLYPILTTMGVGQGRPIGSRRLRILVDLVVILSRKTDSVFFFADRPPSQPRGVGVCPNWRSSTFGWFLYFFVVFR